MRKPSVKTLSTVFDKPRVARVILEMSRARLLATEAGKTLDRDCLRGPATAHIRMHVLNALDRGLHGVECVETTKGEFADYLNTGDMYAPTVIRWRGNYRVQSLGDFVEVQERAGVKFK